MGCQGRISDDGVFKSTGFAKALNKSVLNLPEVTQLPGREKNVPYVLVADDAFPLASNIMKPYAYDLLVSITRIEDQNNEFLTIA